MRFLLLLILFTFSVKADFANIATKASFYKLNNSAFEKSVMKKYRFRWNDKSKSIARAFRGLNFMNYNVTEALVNFNGKGISKVSLYLYNRGDDGNINQKAFSEKVTAVRLSLNKFTKAQERQEKKTGATRASSSYWIKNDVLYQLVYNGGAISKNGSWQSEFIRMDLSYNPGKFANLAGNSFKNAAEVRQNVVKRKDGDVLIQGVPMVDQGRKGYCACATTARVLQYFGREVDQHEIAQLALSTASRGTNPDQLLESLKKMRTKFDLRVSELMHLNTLFTKKLARYYNKLAKKESKKPMDLRYGYMAAFSGDRGLILKARAEMSEFDKFKKNVKTYIQQGIPLSWALMVGIYKENKQIPQAGGGHMRLIIGYNEKTEEIIFTDSWGHGHEEKRMGMKEAWAASTGLYLVKPR